MRLHARDPYCPFAWVIDLLNAPVVLVGPSMRIAYANPSAVALMAARDVLLEAEGNLVARCSTVTRVLKAAVGEAAVVPAGDSRTRAGIAVRCGDDSAAALYVFPLPISAQSDPSAPIAAVLLARHGASFKPPTDVAASLFGLTAAEARVFEFVARGTSAIEIGARLNIAGSTVKTHLLRLYAKTGARRQAELVQLAFSLLPPVAV
ncbi:MAG: helix-turn-helix transcriptional regulator [Sphingomonas sp.]|nr:helix-turn-helix transcriptional regulator [Sphingomonas sp.]